MKNNNYRPCVGMMLFNKQGLIFVGQRLDSNKSFWQMPQGGIEKNEDPKDAAFRELNEEIGTDNAIIISELDNWLKYDLPTNLASRLWKGKFIGQKQKWFAMKFLGSDKEINIRTTNPEFSNWKWLDPTQLPNISVDFKKNIYTELSENLVPIAKQKL